MSKVPIILVTGFLGSGKTTFLKQLALARPDWRLVFLVNEFARTSVDGATLADTGAPTHSVVGGSLFCECKAGDFIRAMREQVMALHREQPLNAVVIETSGAADPEGIDRMMRDHGLGESFEVRQIVSIVAPGNFLKLLHNLPVVDSQIRASGLVIVNKIDTANEETLQEVEKAIRQTAPRAEVRRAQRCLTDFRIPADAPPLPDGGLSECAANPFTAAETDWPPSRSLEAARDCIAALPKTILRIKGRIRTSEGFYHVERSLDGLAIKPASPGLTRLVCIAHDDHESDLEQALHAINPTGAQAALS